VVYRTENFQIDDDPSLLILAALFMDLNRVSFFTFLFVLLPFLLWGQSPSFFSPLSPFQKKAEQLLYSDELEALTDYCKPYLDAEESSKKRAFAHFYTGEVLLMNNQLKKANTHFFTALKYFETNQMERATAAAYLKLGNIAFYEGLMDKAEEHYQKAYRLGQKHQVLPLLYELGQNRATIYSNRKDFERSMPMLKEALKAGIAMEAPEKAAIIYNQISTNYHSVGRLDSAVYYFKELLELKQSIGDTSGLISDLSTLGNLYSELGDHVRAQDHLVDALGKAEQLQDTFSLMSLFTDISKVYAAQGIWSKAKSYAEMGIRMAQDKGIQFIEAQNLKNLGYVFEQEGRLREAIDQYDQALQLFKALNNPLNVVDIQIRLGNLLQDQNDFPGARQYLEEALNIRTRNNDKMGMLDSKLLLGRLEVRQQRYRQAIAMLESCLPVARELNNQNALMKAHRLLAEAHLGRKDHEKAFTHFFQHTQIKDSLLQVKRVREVNRIEAQFQSEKKDKEIAQQKAELEQQKAQIQRRNYENALLIAGLIIFVLLAGLLYFVNVKNRQLNNQKIEVLTKEKEAQRLKAMLEGEEKERRRIARELHDGLGASLATVKMQISAVSSRYPAVKTNNSYQKAENLIDEACQNVREISHNMMPTLLEQNGLEIAIGNVCEQFANSYDLDIEFIPFGLEKEAEEIVQVAVFRICQELLKNAVKHAKANEVIVQLTIEDDHLNLVIEDDGKGFDPGELNQKEGIGLRNIRSRVEYLNGQLDIYSKKGEGSTFTIDIPL